jgi:kynurenine formamidase
MERRLPTKDEILAEAYTHTNWGRWGADDQRGAINLITDEKRVEAARLVRTGRAISLSLDYPKEASANNERPAQHFIRLIDRSEQAGHAHGAAHDYYGVYFHGLSCTHLDALSHVWGRDGGWNGNEPRKLLAADGTRVTWGGVEHWRDGIVTRGVLLDIPRYRGKPCVELGEPIHGWELSEVAAAEGVELRPGDAIITYAGRDVWESTHGPWGAPRHSPRPGLHASCMRFLREADCSMLVWDMMEEEPNEYGLIRTVHSSIHSRGIALIDNAYLPQLVQACAELRQYEFMLVVAPLTVVGGTGSPVNPIAVL